MSSVSKPPGGASPAGPTQVTRFQYFAVTAPGLESVLARELSAMGLDARWVQGGVEGKLTQAELWELHLRSALAESVRIRLKPFNAQDFGALQQGLGRLPWHAYLRRGDAFDVKVTCHKSRLFHSDAVAERVGQAIARVWARANAPAPEPAPEQGSSPAGDRGEPQPEAPVQRIFVRLMRDEVTTSIDASGERLHRRGYRTHVEKAPLRETLAAAMVRLLSELGDESATLCDPFCGSGVLPLEWLQRRTGRLPGAERTFAFERWPIHSAAAWQAVRANALARAAGVDVPSHVIAADIDEKALNSARANAVAAAQDAACQFVHGDFKETLAKLPQGCAVLTNPPYGIRIGNQKTSHKLYLELDRALSERADLRPVVMTCADPTFQKRARLPWRVLAEIKQGGLPLTVLGLDHATNGTKRHASR